MTTRAFDAGRDSAAVLRLWDRALPAYPVQADVFLQRTCGNQNYRPGDGVVAVAVRRLIGFGLTEVVRPTGAPVGKTAHVAACEAAAAYLESRGAETCFIDWTGIPGFYRRVGAQVWRWHSMAEKGLG